MRVLNTNPGAWSGWSRTAATDFPCRTTSGICWWETTAGFFEHVARTSLRVAPAARGRTGSATCGTERDAAAVFPDFVSLIRVRLVARRYTTPFTYEKHRLLGALPIAR